jgi:hypothetical protein
MLTPPTKESMCGVHNKEKRYEEKKKAGKSVKEKIGLRQ